MSGTENETSQINTNDLHALTNLCHQMLGELRETQRDKPGWLVAEKYMSQTIARVETQITPQ